MGTLRSHGLAKQKLTPELWAVKTKEKTVRVLVSQVQLLTLLEEICMLVMEAES